MTSEPPVPAGMRRLWGLAEEPNRLGRPAVLDAARVVAAAIELADHDGLTGVTLPKVANRLGVTSMSLYRYVGSKDELLTLMSDAALGDPPEVRADPANWRDKLRGLATAQRDAIARHPWQVEVPISGPPSGPGHIAWLNATLTVLRDTGLSWGDKVGTVTVVGGFVKQSVEMGEEMAAGRGHDVAQAAAEREWGRALHSLVDSRRFPEAAEMLRSGLFETTVGDPDADNDFQFGLELILDGVEAAIRRTHPGPN